MSKKVWIIGGLVVLTASVVFLALNSAKRKALRESWMQYGSKFSFDDWARLTDEQRNAVAQAQIAGPGTPGLATPPFNDGVGRANQPFDFSALAKTLSDLFKKKETKTPA